MANSTNMRTEGSVAQSFFKLVTLCSSCSLYQKCLLPPPLRKLTSLRRPAEADLSYNAVLFYSVLMIFASLLCSSCSIEQESKLQYQASAKQVRNTVGPCEQWGLREDLPCWRYKPPLAPAHHHRKWMLFICCQILYFWEKSVIHLYVEKSCNF